MTSVAMTLSLFYVTEIQMVETLYFFVCCVYGVVRARWGCLISVLHCLVCFVLYQYCFVLYECFYVYEDNDLHPLCTSWVL